MALHFRDKQVYQVASAVPDATAYQVTFAGGDVIETPLEVPRQAL